jgi:hypothetical protein
LGFNLNINDEEGNNSNLPHRDEAIKYKSETDEEAVSIPADPRKQGPLYVEAQGYLQPAVDFYV